jgi:hypothetical protein
MYPFDNTFLTHERIDDLMRASADIHRGPEGVSVASRTAGALFGPLRRLTARVEDDASSAAATAGIHRPAPRT